jgi:hypothetical protein
MHSTQYSHTRSHPLFSPFIPPTPCSFPKTSHCAVFAVLVSMCVLASLFTHTYIVGCPNDCSGHGQCLSMQDISMVLSQRSPTFKARYGALNRDTLTWDYDVIYGCVCDSSWSVGFGPGEVQLSEYFGADCSLRTFSK